MTTEVSIRRFISVSKDTMKSLQIAPKVLAKRSNVMWDIVLEEAKKLAGCVLITKAGRLQMEYKVYQDHHAWSTCGHHGRALGGGSPNSVK